MAQYSVPRYRDNCPAPYSSGYGSYDYLKAQKLPTSTFRTRNDRYVRSSPRTTLSTPSPKFLTPIYYQDAYAPIRSNSRAKAPRARLSRETLSAYDGTVEDNKVKPLRQENNDKQSDVTQWEKARGPMKTPGIAKARVPAGYSLRNWEPTEEPILLLGSVFDANSLGKWIYDWTVSKHGLAGPLTEWACELWLLLKQLANGEKPLQRVPRTFRRCRGALRVLSTGSLLTGASALPVDPGPSASASGWPSGPGLPSITGWPAPCLGLVFAAAVTHFSKPHTRSRMPGAMALVFNYLSLVASADTTTSPAIMWT